MVPVVEANGCPVASVTGSPSMSPRSSTIGRSPAVSARPRSTATTLVTDSPVVISRSNPPSAARMRA